MAAPFLINLGRLKANELAIASDVEQWVTALAASCTSIDTVQYVNLSITEPKIGTSQISTRTLASGLLSADTDGRSKMADGFLTTSKLADGVLSADVAGLAKMADGFLTWAKVAAASGIGWIEVGTYTANGGSGDNAVVVATGHETDILLMQNQTSAQLWLAYPALGTPATAYFAGGGAATDASAIQQDDDGFTILSGKGSAAGRFNNSTSTIAYVSIALP